MVLGKGKWKDRVVGWLVETFTLAEWEVTFEYVWSGGFSNFNVPVTHLEGV